MPSNEQLNGHPRTNSHFDIDICLSYLGLSYKAMFAVKATLKIVFNNKSLYDVVHHTNYDYHQN